MIPTYISNHAISNDISPVVEGNHLKKYFNHRIIRNKIFAHKTKVKVMVFLNLIVGEKAILFWFFEATYANLNGFDT